MRRLSLRLWLWLSLRLSLPMAGLLAGAIALPAAPAGADDVKIKVQSGFSLSQPVLGEAIAHWRDTVDALGRDDLRVRLYDAGKLVPTLQIFDAVRSGKIDAGFTWPGYWMGKIPATTVFAAIPFGPEPDEFLAWIHEGGGLELWRELYAPHGAVPVPCGVIPPEASGWFAKPIESEADLEGLKIRYAGLGGKVLEKLGASITMLAGGDIFLSLERGVIDATEFSMPAADRPLGFYKIVKHYYFPGWHQPSSILELLVNKTVWDGLTAEQQRFIETTCDANVLFQLTRGLATQPEALDFYRSEGVSLERWPPQLIKRFRALADEVMREQSEADPDFARAWRSLRAFRARHAEWAGMAYAR